MKKRVYIENCGGLCNRLEIFVLACAIQRAFGHEIYLGWPELDALRVENTRRGTPGLWGRWRAARVRVCSEGLFQSLANRRNIILRGLAGPDDRMEAVYAEAASRLGVEATLARDLVEFFRAMGPNPVVGIHLRQGDYPLLSNDVYDLHQATLSAVPVWWHEWVMGAILKLEPATRFLLCHNGSPEAVAQLKRNFDVLEVPKTNPYRTSWGHRSPRHPVADLFALACCPVILATPVSSFSHYAANVLGPESTCLMPPPRMTRISPALVAARIGRRPLQRWVEASLNGQGAQDPTSTFSGINLDQAARTTWLQAGQTAGDAKWEKTKDLAEIQ
jgi:hypothetical protein